MTAVNMGLTYPVNTKKSYAPNSRTTAQEGFFDAVPEENSETKTRQPEKNGFEMSQRELMSELANQQSAIKDRLEHPMKYADEKSVPIGGAELTEEEWDKMMSRVDLLLEDAKNEANRHSQNVTEQMKNKGTEQSPLFSEKGGLGKTGGADVTRESQEKIKERFSGKNKYFHQATDGVLEHNGVIFQCDYATGALKLGDCSRKDQCLRIPLSSGGSLMVGPNSIDGLSRAIDLFDAADQYRILEAIELYKMAKDKENELEDAINGDPTEETEVDATATAPEEPEAEDATATAPKKPENR